MAGNITIKNTIIGEGMPCICVPLTERTLSRLQTEAKSAVAVGPDLVEWRADFFEEIDKQEEVERTLEELYSILGDIPLIFTIRTKKEGGNLEISPEEYAKILKNTAAAKKPPLMDVEILQLEESLLQSIIETLHQMGTRIIGSSHHFEKTPSEKELEEILQREDQAGADILKLAVMPQNYRDLARLLNVTGQMKRSGCPKPVITMSMGELGSASRFCGEIFGSCVTFATVGEASAPGQLPIDDLRELLKTFHTHL